MTNSHKSKNLIIVISSPSGAGKSSICKRLLKDDPQLNISISDTTRPPRDNETNGTDYNFIEKYEFENRINNNEYGYCVKCGEAISPKRLEYDLATPLCINCASN